VGRLDDENEFHRRIDRHGRLIRWLAVGLMAVSLGLVCSNMGNVVSELSRIF
jgi:hypothetical protein